MRSVFAIFGSPRAQSFSAELHQAFLAPIRQAGFSVTEFHPCRENFSACTGCGICANAACVYNDAVSRAYEGIANCSLVSVSAPVYFSSLPAQLKAAIDRCQYLWERRTEMPRKHGFFISAAGSSYATAFTGSLLTMKHFFKTINASFTEDDFILLSNSDSIAKLPEALLIKAEKLGKRYASFI